MKRGYLILGPTGGGYFWTGRLAIAGCAWNWIPWRWRTTDFTVGSGYGHAAELGLLLPFLGCSLCDGLKVSSRRISVTCPS